MSIYSNLAGSSTEGAAQYIDALLKLLGDREAGEVLQSTVGWCSRHVEGLTAEQLAAPEAPGKWSIAAVLEHLADSELVWGYRLRKVVAEDRPVLTGYDQDLWAERLGYDQADARQSVALFAALRSGNLRLLERLQPEDLDRVAVHAERGEETVRHMMRLYAGHDLLHRKQLQRIRDGFAV